LSLRFFLDASLFNQALLFSCDLGLVFLLLPSTLFLTAMFLGKLCLPLGLLFLSLPCLLLGLF
jgi:hypothetical protein